MRASQLDKAIAQLEYEISVLQAALAKLKAAATPKPARLKEAKPA